MQTLWVSEHFSWFPPENSITSYHWAKAAHNPAPELSPSSLSSHGSQRDMRGEHSNVTENWPWKVFYSCCGPPDFQRKENVPERCMDIVFGEFNTKSTLVEWGNGWESHCVYLGLANENTSSWKVSGCFALSSQFCVYWQGRLRRSLSLRQ